MKKDIDKTLEEIWSKLQDLIKKAVVKYGKEDLEAIRFRGYNPKSANSTDMPGDMELWINLTKSSPSDLELCQEYLELLQELWLKVMEAYENNKLDHLLIAPSGNPIYKPGVHCHSIENNDRIKIWSPKEI